jgi:hypothetical protein
MLAPSPEVRIGQPVHCKASLRLAPLGLDGARTGWPLALVGARTVSVFLKNGHFHLLIRIDPACLLNRDVVVRIWNAQGCLAARRSDQNSVSNP